jgi:hypothetical protein
MAPIEEMRELAQAKQAPARASLRVWADRLDLAMEVPNAGN